MEGRETGGRVFSEMKTEMLGAALPKDGTKNTCWTWVGMYKDAEVGKSVWC